MDFPLVQRAIGVAAAEYLRLVWHTCEFGIDPADIYTRVRPDLPAIVAMWHGQHFMMPFFKRKEHLVKVLISRHRDGEINAVAASRLGVEPIRGSGTQRPRFPAQRRRRRLSADAARRWREAIMSRSPPTFRRSHALPAAASWSWRAPRDGRSIRSRVATSRYIELKSWDRSVLNLPFGRFAIAVGEPIRVAAAAGDAALEDARRLVESRLNATTERAYAIAEGRAKDFVWGRSHIGSTQVA